MIQIRNVPERLHRTLKVRAAQAGMTLSDYLLKELKQSTELPTFDELSERIRRHEKVRGQVDSVNAVRKERDAHK